MKRLLFTYSCLIFLLFASSDPLSAQRTWNGEGFIGVNQFISGYAIPSGGLGIEGGQYLLHSYWKAGVRAVDWNQKVSGILPEGDEEGETLYFDHILWNLSGSWMYRLASSYGRGINLYAGIGAFLGINHYEVFHPLPQELESGFPKAEFVYGAEPAVDIELFLLRRVALVVGVQSPFTLSSSLRTDLWHLSGSLGVRIDL